MTRNRMQWFASLAALTYPQSPAQAIDAFRAMAPVLADLPEGAFTDGSLHAVAMAERKMQIPAYDDIRRGLSAWWRDNRPDRYAQPALTHDRAPGWTPPTQAEVAAVAEKLKAHRAGRLSSAVKSSVPEDRPAASYVNPRALLATYEAQAKGATTEFARTLAYTRVEALRKLIRVEKEGFPDLGAMEAEARETEGAAMRRVADREDAL